ncbi:MAG: nucleotidyltransferase family protein [Isosphaeraceae bacterium]
MNTSTTISQHGITLPMDPIAEFCRRWKIRELAVFGSFLRDDFGDQSDIDLLIDATTGARWTFADLLAMQEEMARLLGRKVEFVDRTAVERSRNYIRRRHILATAVPIYVRGESPADRVEE